MGQYCAAIGDAAHGVLVEAVEPTRPGETNRIHCAAGRQLGTSGSSEFDRLVIAVVDLPYATVRRYLLSGKPIPAHAARLVEQGTKALLTH